MSSDNKKLIRMFCNSKKLLVLAVSLVMFLSCALSTYAQTNNTDAQTDTVFTGTEEKPVSDGAWNYDAKADTWTYTSSKQFKNTWAYITNPWNENKPAWFRFDENGKMLTGWQKIYWNGGYKYFYFHETKDGKRGELLVSGVTPDGYTVDENGVWTVDGVAQEYYYQTSGSGSSGSRTIKDDTLRIKDILPKDFPFTESTTPGPARDAWVAAEDKDFVCYSGNKEYVIDPFLYFETRSTGARSGLSVNTVVTESGGNYVCEYDSGDQKVAFVMSNGVLEHIEHFGTVGDSEFFFSYAPLTIADILPDNFPFAENPASGAPEDAWTAEDKDFVCYSGNKDYSKVPYLYFETLSTHEMSSVPLDTPVKENGENYGEYFYCHHDHGDQMIAFYMSEGKLEHIEHSGTVGSDLFLLSYKPPQNNEEESKTIADILPDDFPSSSHYWRGGSGQYCSKEGDYLVFKCIEKGGYTHICNLRLSVTVVRNGENYVFADDHVDITFVMSDEGLTAIEFNAKESGYSVYNGTYTPQNNEEEPLTIADIIPEDFPTSKDDAWRTENGSLCFKCEDEGVMCICFHYEDSYVKTTMTLPLTDTVVQSGENYVAHYRPYDDITFYISEGQLEKIKFLAYSDKEQEFDGIYFPPQNHEELFLMSNGEPEQIELNNGTEDKGVYVPLQNNEEPCIENQEVQEPFEEEQDQITEKIQTEPLIAIDAATSSEVPQI